MSVSLKKGGRLDRHPPFTAKAAASLAPDLLQHTTQPVHKVVERACNTAAPVSGFGLFDLSRSPYLGRSMPQHVQRSLERTERQAWRQKQRAAI
jgi:hypothetical protein